MINFKYVKNIICVCEMQTAAICSLVCVSMYLVRSNLYMSSIDPKPEDLYMSSIDPKPEDL